MRAPVLILAAVVVALLPGCEVLEIQDFPCPSGGTTLTFENFGQGFFGSYCNSCHSAPSGERDGAPSEYVFSTVEQVRQHKERIFARSAGPNTTMPIGPDDPPREERDKLAEWLACGAP
jgi:uncharacterized membrane protein